MSRCSKLLSWLAALAFALPGAAGWSETADEFELKAAYIYRFAQFTTWPNPPAGEFNFCIQGDHPIRAGLNKLQGKTLQDAPVNVLRVDSAEAAGACHVLFLHLDRPRELAEWMAALRSRPVLVVSDSPAAFQEKAMIVFAMEPNRVTFRINLTVARDSGLFLSSQMLKLAQEVR